MAGSGGDTNALGERGEALLRLAITTYHGSGPLFRVAFLGDKWPIADVAVELVGHPGFFFLAQIKATKRGVNANSRLRASISQEHFNDLVSPRIPTYVIGVDEPNEGVYISAAIAKRSAALSSLNTEFSLDDPMVRRTLFREVRDFWRAVRSKRLWRSTAFRD
jgi:hypothetical protein